MINVPSALREKNYLKNLKEKAEKDGSKSQREAYINK
jgi:hypothetical protein